MFEKFGEFDSWEEINKKADELFNKGDVDGIRSLAVENGIDTEDADEFIEGAVEELITPVMAAVGKISVEAKELDLQGFIKDIAESISQWCMEEEQLCLAVRKKGKTLVECMGRILKAAFENKVQLSEKIVKAAGLKTPLYLGIPSRADIKQIVIKYYLG